MAHSEKILNEIRISIANKPLGERMRITREILNREYPRQYTRAIVSKESQAITYQGLRYLEDCTKGEARTSTIKALCLYYEIPMTLITEGVIAQESTNELEFDNNAPFSYKLRMMRKTFGVSIEEMSKGLGITIERLQEIERG